jgi:O-antigen/teichoic acid export membrane protein
MDNKARRFALIKFASIVLNVVLNIYFVAILHKSIVSIFWAGLATSLLSTVLLLPDIFKKLHFRLRHEVLKPLLLFGLPTIPAGLAAMVVQVIDKPIMRLLTDARTVGIYGANYKLGIFMMLVVSMFQYAWQPFFLQNASRDNAKLLFARIMTYFVLCGMTIVLLLSLFIQNVVTFPLFGHRYLIHPDYWSGLGIVPIILFGYLWTGMGMILNAGLLIEKRAGYLPLVTGAGAAVNIAANIWWIPLYGIFGGAFATLAAYMVMAILYWIVTIRIYPVPYEYFRLAKIGVAALIPALLWYLLPVAGIPDILWKVLLFGMYLLALFILGFFTQAERSELKRMLLLFRRSKSMDEA